MEKVIIVGSGPSGLLLAHYLLRRGNRYQVEIYERLGDPRLAAPSNTRSFPISLSTRGKNALRKIDGLLEAVEAKGAKMQSSILHQPKGKQSLLSFKTPLIAIDRIRLTNALLSELIEKYDSSQFNIHFDCQCTQVDLKARQVKFQKQDSAEEFAVDCDLLIGADGARSAVRNSFLNAGRFELEQKYFRDDYKSLYLPKDKNETELQPDCIHVWVSNSDSRIIAVPQPDGSWSGTIIFERDSDEILGLTTVDRAREFFDRNFPEASKLMPNEEIEALLERPIASVLTIRCNRYHYEDWVLIMGDAAHGVSPSLGQGCNAALEDAAILDALLDEYEDNLAEALPEFTARRLADARALWELSDNAFPSSKLLFMEFLLRRAVAKTMNKFFPQWFPLLPSDLLRDTTIPYAEVLKLNRGWVSKVKKANGVLNV
ncbi:MAG: FAD-dependent monooxygenase [Oscillatoria sp. SIO1A7]|nr:FAD-dependent monooxygenase [Oscillatoria sp. SIO1A7]